MEKSQNKARLQPPFRPEELVSVRSFISYCKDNGAGILKEQLEKLHKEGLFYPAIKVYRGINIYKKIFAKFRNAKEWRFVNHGDIKKFKPQKIARGNYYHPGRFSMENDKWLEYYKKNKMVEYPASQKFMAWIKKQYTGFITNKKLIEKDYEFFYDKIQLLSLKVIIKEKKFLDKFEGKSKQSLMRSIKNHLGEINNFFQVYIEMEELVRRAYKVRHGKISEYQKEELGNKEIKKLWEADIKEIISPTLRKETQNILIKNNFSLDDIDRWRKFLAWQNLFYESNRSMTYIKIYLKSISEKDLINTEDVNYMIYILNSFEYFLTGNLKTVKQIISNTSYPPCTICGNLFMPIRINQKTCGSEKCIRENKNRSKRKKK